MIDKIKKDCEKKKEFLEKAVYPPYLSAGGQTVNLAATATTTTASSTAGTPSLSSPLKELDSNPYGIASLANTMPTPRQQKKGKNYTSFHFLYLAFSERLGICCT